MPAIIVMCATVFVFAQPTLEQIDGAEPPTIETTEFSLGFPDVETLWFFEHALIPCETVRGFPLRFNEIVDAECHSYPQDSAKGINESGPVVFPDKDVLLPVLTSVFMHANFLHLLLNMLVLWSIGRIAEIMIGSWRFLAIYLASGVAASLGFVAVNSDSTIILMGASGAISGIMGALFFWTNDSDLRRWVAGLALINVIGWSVATFADIDFGIAWAAHLFGLAFGAVVGLAFYKLVNRPRPAYRIEPAEIPYQSGAERRLNWPHSGLTGPPDLTAPLPPDLTSMPQQPRKGTSNFSNRGYLDSSKWSQSRPPGTRTGPPPPPPPPPQSPRRPPPPVSSEVDPNREPSDQGMADYFRWRYAGLGPEDAAQEQQPPHPPPPAAPPPPSTPPPSPPPHPPPPFPSEQRPNREPSDQGTADYFRRRYVAASSGLPAPQGPSPITAHFRRRWTYWAIGVLCLAIGLTASALLDGSTTEQETGRSAEAERADLEDGAERAEREDEDRRDESNDRAEQSLDEALRAEGEALDAMDDFDEAGQAFVRLWNARVAGQPGFAIDPDDVYALEAELVAARRHLERARSGVETADAAYSSLPESLQLLDPDWRKIWQDVFDEAEAWLRVNERDVAELG